MLAIAGCFCTRWAAFTRVRVRGACWNILGKHANASHAHRRRMIDDSSCLRVLSWAPGFGALVSSFFIFRLAMLALQGHYVRVLRAVAAPFPGFPVPLQLPQDNDGTSRDGHSGSEQPNRGCLPAGEQREHRGKKRCASGCALLALYARPHACTRPASHTRAPPSHTRAPLHILARPPLIPARPFHKSDRGVFHCPGDPVLAGPCARMTHAQDRECARTRV